MEKPALRLIAVLTILGMAALFGNACTTEPEDQTPDEPTQVIPIPANQTPVISSLSGDLASLAPGDSTTITSVASDPDGDHLSYSWSTTGGTLSGTGEKVTWTAPEAAGAYSISVTVDDGRGATADQSYAITVVAEVMENRPPSIVSISASPKTIEPNAATTITCVATDPDGDTLIYRWINPPGIFSFLEGAGNVVILPQPNQIIEGTGDVVTWTAPDDIGEYVIKVSVSDSRGGTTTETVTVKVAPNKPPRITKLSAKPETVYVEGSVTITSEARDPEGGPLTYSWSASQGSISGTGEEVIWTAPAITARAVIEVTVTDELGASTTDSITVEVRGRIINTPIKPLVDESGSIHADGRIQDSWRVGDTGANNGIRAFLSFNISDIRQIAEFRSAVLSINTTDQNGTPWADLDSLFIDTVDYGRYRIHATDYDLSGDRLASYDTAPITEIDLTQIIKRAVRDGSSRFRIKLYFQQETDNNDLTDNIKITSAVLTVNYVQKTW